MFFYRKLLWRAEGGRGWAALTFSNIDSLASARSFSRALVGGVIKFMYVKTCLESEEEREMEKFSCHFSSSQFV